MLNLARDSGTPSYLIKYMKNARRRYAQQAVRKARAIAQHLAESNAPQGRAA